MSPDKAIFDAFASRPRNPRAAKALQRDLAKRAKEQARLSALELARLEVDEYENRIAVLLSVHKDCGPTRDWIGYACELSEPLPCSYSLMEWRALADAAFTGIGAQTTDAREAVRAEIERNRAKDQAELIERIQSREKRVAMTEEIRLLAERVMAGEAAGYLDALVRINPFQEISDLGTAIHFTVHDRRTIECRMKVNGNEVIPAEQKSMTAAGKVSIKAMPKGRFHELYQDYVCGCALRVAREVFALLPIETVLITASVDELDSRTGLTTEISVLSVIIPQEQVSQLNFDDLDPSDAIENFMYRGDFKKSKRTGQFETIAPLTIEEIPTRSGENFETISNSARTLLAIVTDELFELKPMRKEQP